MGGRRLNHVAVTVPDLDQAAAGYEALGFAVTPRSDHPFGTSNRLVVLSDCYIELVAVTRPELIPADGFGAYVAAAVEAGRWGPLTIVFASDDIQADRRRLIRLGLPAPEALTFSRLAVSPGGEETRVAFEVAFTDLHDPGLNGFFCRHLTPEEIWTETSLRHPNGAERLTAVDVPDGRPETLSRLAAVADGELVDGRVILGETAVGVGSTRLAFAGQRSFRRTVAGTVVEMTES